MSPYQREISRDHKACILFLLDQSYSMSEPWAGSQRQKCDELAMAVNRWLYQMAIRASGDEGIRDWMDIGVIGYRTDPQGNPIIEPALTGPLAGRSLVSITDIGNHPDRIETTRQMIEDDETGEIVEVPTDEPVWIDPVAEGGTPMCHVLHHAHGLLKKWITAHSDSFPPLVVHITDGESQDGDPLPYAEAVRQLATSDGKVLLLNCHLSMTAADQILFVADENQIPDQVGRVLFRMSSELPPPLYRTATVEGFPLAKGARGMAFNADMAVLIQFLDMGTRAAVQAR